MKVLKIVAAIAGVELMAPTKDGIDASLNLTKLSILKDGSYSADQKGVIKITGPGLSLPDKGVLEGRGNVSLDIQASGTKELSDLRGLTIPVRLSGPFDALTYRIDFAAAANEAAEAVKQQVQEKVKKQLQDRLKGLLKR